MEFTKSLLKGKLIKRYKRFFVDIKLNKSIVKAHCPNTGSMKGLLEEGNDVYVLKHDDPKRKLKYTLEMIKSKNKIIGVNTHRANRIVEHGLKNKLFNDLINLQIKEPLKENELAKSIDVLGEITDLTSKKVKKQYEANPYPRWRFAKDNLKFDFFFN